MGLFLVLSEAVLVIVIDRLFGCPVRRVPRRFEHEHEHRPQAA